MNDRWTWPKAVWTWHVFGRDECGNSLMVVNLNFHVPWWRRTLTRILFGSVWERIKTGS